MSEISYSTSNKNYFQFIETNQNDLNLSSMKNNENVSRQTNSNKSINNLNQYENNTNKSKFLIKLTIKS